MDICAFVVIKTDFSLNELASVLSRRLCGGIEFGGEDESLREEVPAVYTQRDFLGLRLVLYGYVDEYCLDLEQWEEHESSDVNEREVDLSEHLLLLLGRINGLHVQLGRSQT